MQRKRKRNRKKTSRLLSCLLVGLAILLYIEFFHGVTPFTIKEAPMPTGLHPEVEMKAEALVTEAANKGIAIKITDGFRSSQQQDELYQKGRSLEGQIVTHAEGGDSYHNYGLAIDFAIITSDGRVIWDMDYDGNGNGKSDWMEVVAFAKSLGFDWGGDWIRFKDYPHLQMDFGLSIRELKRGKRPPGSEAVEES
ncbi:M15 family metallopeptidase [Bacillus massilinigeriensis]|uniref:M15 family metallopeptidase n=1 Tax=Bacillus mediterraneensis TaxID=1805474 RepID=UPI0008F8D2F4|nr:M15 family metallopeptidase [Bacillus mediterraneensis]